MSVIGADSSMRQLQRAFLAILPRIKRHGRFYFRDIKCAMKKSDAISEAIALCWKWFVRLAQRGKDATRFVSTLAMQACRHVSCGRWLCGSENSKDVMAMRCRSRHGYVVAPLPAGSSMMGNVFDEALHDNTRSSPAEAAAFRVDWPQWMQSLKDRDRRIIRLMAMGEGTKDIARRVGVSAGRISQLRREYKDGWEEFVGDKDEMVAA